MFLDFYLFPKMEAKINYIMKWNYVVLGIFCA